jgi:hypothetical protein
MADSQAWCHPNRGVLLQRLQELSVAMLRAATTAMSVRSPITELSLTEVAGGCLAFSGADVPLTRAVGVGTSGSVRQEEVETVESFYKSRSSAIRVVISERTDPWLPVMLRKRGYESGDFMQNWWLPLETKAALAGSEEIEIVPAGLNQADQWVRTVGAGFEENDSPVDEARIPRRALDTFTASDLPTALSRSSPSTKAKLPAAEFYTLRERWLRFERRVSAFNTAIKACSAPCSPIASMPPSARDAASPSPAPMPPAPLRATCGDLASTHFRPVTRCRWRTK